MPQTLFRLLMATTLAAACSRSGGPATNTPGTAKTTSSADGSVAPAGATAAQMPHDSISDRADAGRILGDSAAAIWVVMASDFQCPFCKTWHDSSFQKLLATYVNTGRIRLAFLNMPLSMHRNAVPASEAAMCASVQKKFWQVHESLFATQTRWETMPDPVPAFDSIAAANHVDMAPWRQCMTNHLTRPLIQADHDRASSIGVNGTPAFFVDGQRVNGGAETNLGPPIDSALARHGKK